MSRLDKIKNAIAIVLLLMVMIPFILLGKDHNVTRTAAAFAIISWLATMFYINHLKKKNSD